MRLKNKNIILTGASSGIGLALLEKLLEYDCHIIAVARTIEQIDIQHDRIIKYTCDISNRENVDRLFKFAQEKLGAIDLFIANAGFAYYEQIATPDWQRIENIYQTNVFSAIYSATKMKEVNSKRNYRMVITASAMSFLAVPGYSLYASTKAALHGFACGYRSELKKGQKLQMIYPISTKTNFFDQAAEETPVSWPVQSSNTVAKAIIKGIKKDKNSIFPSTLFYFLNVLNGYLPFVHRLISAIENRKFQKWLGVS
ncbi:SDR family NAD(P)-dependent oxidoreductase [bacterium]|nr:SDR family NAD(P)-dependent oxidoreductase [bacterium]